MKVKWYFPLVLPSAFTDVIYTPCIEFYYTLPYFNGIKETLSSVTISLTPLFPTDLVNHSATLLQVVFLEQQK